MSEIKFFIKCKPPRTTYQAGQQILRTRAGRWFIGKNAKGHYMSTQLRRWVRPHAPKEPMDGALSVRLEWVFPFRKNEKKAIKEMALYPKITKPDCDNLAKGLLDALEAEGFFINDANIWDLQVKKYYANHSGIAVKIYKIKNWNM
jgi:Holliday junction resolvase RusA-like endonuclease